MSPKPTSHGRIVGLETEFGCLVEPSREASEIVHRIRDWVFEGRRYGLIDLHERDWEEPAGNGGFLFSGGRLYIDMGHIEYCTAECATIADVVRQDRAGDRLLLHAIHSLGLTDRVQLFRNNIDHRTNATFGCHENYSMQRNAPLNEGNVLSLLTFLTLRVLFTGSGRVGSGGHRFGPKLPDSGVEFQISQRADYIENDFYEWVQQNRAIINTRDEPLADPRRYRRLHLLHGDTNVLPSALYLKTGATRLVLDLLELDDLPPLILADAVGTLKAISRQPSAPWRVTLADGSQADPVELLSRYRTRAAHHFAGRDQESDAILALWERVEIGLSHDLNGLVGVLDWVTKRHLLTTFRESEGLPWNDPWLEAQDLEYHHLDPDRSLGLALADMNGPWGPASEVDLSGFAAPLNTRAHLRSLAMKEIATTELAYSVDWHHVELQGRPSLKMPDPFDHTFTGFPAVTPDRNAPPATD